MGAVPGGVWRAGRWALALLYFIFAATLLALRYGVLPNIDAYRGDLERSLSASLGLRVQIRSIDADWQGLNPRLALHGLQVLDQAGRPALAFDNVEAVVSWTSLPLLALRLDRLAVEAPILALRREADGSLYVAGMRVDPAGEGEGFPEWLLRQRNVVIRNATVHWQDLQRGAPALELRHVNLRLENFGARHRFGLTAEPPPSLAAGIDLRGEFRGRDLNRLDQWQGEAYARLSYADLAVWRQWIDYPVDLPQGSGALRLWLEIAHGHVEAATADLALSNVRLRLKPELPMLDLLALEGRLSAALPPERFELGARHLSLATRDGVRIPSADFTLRWHGARERDPAHGDFSAAVVDLDAVARLAAHLPLGAPLRKRLAEAAPRGRLLDLELAWSGAVDAAQTYRLRTRLDRFGINPLDVLPGCVALSGSVEASEKGGKLNLASRGSALLLPRVFPEARVALDQLNAQASWVAAGDGVEVNLQSLSFSNADAAGSGFGRYRYKPGGSGEIDLTARLTRANAGAAWRYMPHVTTPEVRAWLRNGIVAGRSDDTRLRLKGDLEHFPFVDPKLGSFQVSGRFAGAVLRFAPGWPEMKDVAGDLLFEGRRMLITAHQGAVRGVGVSGVSAEIPDLGADDTQLLVRGRAAGPTADFLRYVGDSPVADWIDHFTDGMTARGNGNLQLALTLPLSRPDDGRVEGEFVFANNQVSVAPDLPPLSAASARVQFSETKLAIRDGSATLLGSPLTLSAQTQDGGGVAVTLQGSASAAGLRQHFDSPLLDHLSGSASWRGGIRLHRNRVDAQLESNLLGVSSSLPEPFNKSAGEPVALRIERSSQPEVAVMARGVAPSRELLKLRVGNVLNASLWRRLDASGGGVERGVIGLNETPLAAPDRGVLVAGRLKHLDVDAWRRILLAGAEATPPLPISALDLRADSVTAFGQSLSDFSLRASLADAVWQADVGSRELAGALTWRQQGKGRLRARLKHLSLAEVKPQNVGEAASAEPDVKELPGLDVVADAFSLRGKALGRLELQAVNQARLWRIDRLRLENPDGSLDATGQWRPGSGSGATGLVFRLDAADSGKLLERLGYGNAVRRGSAKLEGKVGWNGAPSSIDYPSLDGSMTLEVGRGQFARLEPGVGRLLGVLSLQSLPRRITLDFRDVFSEGFAFDSISGSIAMKRGVLETQDLRIQGPSAKVLMKGEVSVAGETQNLKVRVQPTLSETFAIGAAVINPVAGAVTYLAQKVLKDPLEQMFSYEYSVTGSWTDPKVEKIAARAPAVQP